MKYTSTNVIKTMGRLASLKKDTYLSTILAIDETLFATDGQALCKVYRGLLNNKGKKFLNAENAKKGLYEQDDPSIFSNYPDLEDTIPQGCAYSFKIDQSKLQPISKAFKAFEMGTKKKAVKLELDFKKRVIAFSASHGATDLKTEIPCLSLSCTNEFEPDKFNIYLNADYLYMGVNSFNNLHTIKISFQSSSSSPVKLEDSEQLFLIAPIANY